MQPNDYFAREEFCHRLLRNQVLCTQILFTDEAFFNEGGITNTRNSHGRSSQDENPHAVTETHFHARFSMNISCGVIGKLLKGPFELEDRLTGDRYRHFLQEQLPRYCKMCLWKSGGRGGCSEMAHLLIVVIPPFSTDSSQPI
jgi:hypothetical protein